MGMVEMDLSKFPVFRMMSGKMRWLSSRQSVLSQNIANADTPNYVPRDIKAPNFKEILGHEMAPVKVERSDHILAGARRCAYLVMRRG